LFLEDCCAHFIQSLHLPCGTAWLAARPDSLRRARAELADGIAAAPRGAHPRVKVLS
jgi:hypothetical protein